MCIGRYEMKTNLAIGSPSIDDALTIQVTESTGRLNDCLQALLPKMDSLDGLYDAAGFNELKATLSEQLEAVFKPFSNLSLDLPVGGLGKDFLSGLFEPFELLLNDYNIKFPYQKEDIETSIRAWADYGWVLPERMPLGEWMAFPTSLEEADSRAAAYIDDASIASLFDDAARLTGSTLDISEAKALFFDGRYKPCAMLLCAEIEGTIIKSRKRVYVDISGRRKRREVAKIVRETELEVDGATRIWSRIAALPLVINNKYWLDGKDFDPDQEGEFNRNFIDHGMDTKPVTKTICIKLLLLLGVVTEVFCHQKGSI